MSKSYIKKINKFGPCPSAVEWMKCNRGGVDAAADYAACGRGDWLLWLAHELGLDAKLLAAASLRCVLLILPLFPTDECRPLAAIAAVEARMRGENPDPSLRSALDAARSLVVDYSNFDDDTARYYAARAIRYVALVAEKWDEAGWDWAVVEYAGMSCDFSVRDEMQARCASEVRGIISFEMLAAALGLTPEEDPEDA